jgi:hypothetical protein
MQACGNISSQTGIKSLKPGKDVGKMALLKQTFRAARPFDTALLASKSHKEYDP